MVQPGAPGADGGGVLDERGPVDVERGARREFAGQRHQPPALHAAKAREVCHRPRGKGPREEQRLRAEEMHGVGGEGRRRMKDEG